MSKTLANQNLKLLEVIHSEMEFLQNFSIQHLPEISNKANVFVFSSGTILAQQKQQIDYIGFILQGKITVSGFPDKKSTGFIFGHLKYMNLLKNHARTIVGDSDGLVLAIRISEIGTFSPQIQNIFNEMFVRASLGILKNEDNGENEWINEEEKKGLALCAPQVKAFFTEQIEEKQRKIWFKYFPFKIVNSKDLILKKSADCHLLYLIKGELISKNEHTSQRILPGQFYNTQGFLLNCTSNSNIYCISDQATVMIINRKSFLKVMKSTTLYKLSNFLLRSQINEKHYQIETYEKRKEKQRQKNVKYSVFNKSQEYQILPLNFPSKSNTSEKLSKNKSAIKEDLGDTEFFGAFYREQMAQSKNVKTASSNNSKINRAITLKTEKNEAAEKSSSENQVKTLQKELEQMNTRMKYYEENYIKLKLDMIEYQSKFNMNSVFKQINEMGDKQIKNKNLALESAKSATLKTAFEEELKNNRIMQVVARCAYKWLWTVRRKKQKKLFAQTQN